MRKIGSGHGMVSAYPRQLESLIRLAESHAKVRFSEKVETIDVEEAKRLHREALKQSATDPRTGFVDISILTTGRRKWSSLLSFYANPASEGLVCLFAFDRYERYGPQT